MREIKFRAWDKKRDEMEYFDLGHKDGLLYACGEWQVATGYDSEDNPTFDDDNVPCRYELMQFTGLHDKDGFQDIYEGDIIDGIGNVRGNIYENTEMDSRPTDLIIQDFGGRDWGSTYATAISRGCTDAQ